MVFISLTRLACSTRSWQEALQKYEDGVKGTAGDRDIAAAEATSAYRRRMLADVHGFDHDRRFEIHETVGGIANRLRRSPGSRGTGKTTAPSGGKAMSLQLLDRDLDGIPDQFAYLLPEARSTQDFGFMFAINRDGRMDCLVFNGGPAVTKVAVMYWMSWHRIDSNGDGRSISR